MRKQPDCCIELAVGYGAGVAITKQVDVLQHLPLIITAS